MGCTYILSCTCSLNCFEKWQQWENCPMSSCSILYYCWCSLQVERLILQGLYLFADTFFLFAKDKCILKLVNFDKKMELKNFKRYQHINSLLVKCSEVENIAAGFMLAKVILVSSSRLLLGGWQKAECDIHPCDFAKLSEISCILATNVPAQDCEVVSFVAYFLPKQASTTTSEVSQTRLVHFQLVKLFLLNGSLHDLTEMSVFLKCYIKFFVGVTEEDDPLVKYILKFIDTLVFHEEAIKIFGNKLMELNRRFAGCAGYEVVSNAIRECIDRKNSHIAELRALIIRFIELYLE